MAAFELKHYANLRSWSMDGKQQEKASSSLLTINDYLTDRQMDKQTEILDKSLLEV